MLIKKENTQKDLALFLETKLKVGLSPSKKKFFYLLQWKPFKNDEKPVLFILEALHISRYLKFCSELSVMSKTAWLER